MNDLKLKRGHIKACVTRALAFAEAVDNRVPLELLEIRLQKLEEGWKEFESLHNQLLGFSTEADFVDPEPDFIEYESKYFLAYSTLAKEIRQRNQSRIPVPNESAMDKFASQQASLLESLSAPQQSVSVSLPKLIVPIFSGDYKEWPCFRDLFVGSIDTKPNLSPTQKFQYLKSFLRGEAAALIRHIVVSDSNYLDAWERLESRYDRANLIIQSHIQSFLSLPSVQMSASHSLRKITDAADETIRGLNALKSTGRDPWVIYILLQKLDSETREAWAKEVGNRDNCTIDELLSFLHLRCDALESCQSSSRSFQSRGKTSKTLHTHLAESNPQCPNCKSVHHMLSKCAGFLALDINTRRNFVKERSLCFNCLRSGHSSSKCRSNFRCRICNSRHHSLVHHESSPSQNSANNQLPSSSSASSQNLQNIATTPHSSSLPKPFPNVPVAINSSNSLCSSIFTGSNSSNPNRFTQTILPTAVAYTSDKQGTLQSIRLLLDSGSQVSFVTEHTVQRLGLVRKNSRIPVLGVGSTPSGVTNGTVTLKLFSRFTKKAIEVDCHIISKLTSLMPPSVSIIQDTTTFSSFTLADPKFNVPGHIDLLIGADKAFSVFNGSAIRGQQGMPDLVPTIFGWVVCGNMNSLTSLPSNNVNSFCTQLDHTQTFDLERFWRLEEIPQEPRLSVEDQRAEDIFANTHTRLPGGRYEVQLPFKSDEETEFGNTFTVALNRFQSLERRITGNQYLKEKYVSFMNEYLSLGHMEEIPAHEIEKSSSQCYYLPHHAVMKGDSSTTKVRVVFDGSARAGHNSSLNDSLLIGQTYQRDLFSICIRFRRHRYTISGDIEKMFRQIRVSAGHTNFQRILWRDSIDRPLKHFRLLTVTYGTACAPFLAVRTLLQLALDSKDTYPRAAEVLLNDFYIDDVMTGADSVEEVTTLRMELITLLRAGGFNLRKWTTNCWPLLLSLPDDQRELTPKEFEENSSVKLLGLQWSPAQDSFSYKVHLNECSTFTKRLILSESSKIFDPLGFLSPVVIGVKVLFQELWLSKYDWDDVVSDEHCNRWLAIRQDLHILETISIPRIMWSSYNIIQFHGFCDASLDAYAAVVYCRSVDSAGCVTSNIVAAKSRVAPVKVISLPRLELCGAVLLTRLVNKLKTSLQHKEAQVYAWTDSAIVLHWLSALPKRWSVFISNRTSEILSSIPRPSWHHVRSHENPADCASRGIPPTHLLKNELWWSGPSWIRQEPSNWPDSVYTVKDIPNEHFEERKRAVAQVYVSEIEATNVFETLINKSSQFLKAIRVLAHVFRFISNSRVHYALRKGQSLSSEELSYAKTKLIRFHQSSCFSSEINAIAKCEVLKKGNKLASLTPFLDQEGVLRVGGRINESDVPYSTKHPIIIHKNTRLAKLIVEHIHKSNLHAGVSQMVGILRQEYFIIGCRNLLRKVVYECVSCFRYRKNTSSQLMGNLPAERVRFSRPFSKVGLDYAGPITIRLARGRNPKFVKAYISLFVCFTTKAIHLELVGDLSSVAFLAALDRFASRRGKPSEIWSDNGTNFHGAKKNIDEMFQLLLSQQHNNIVTDHLAKDKVAWKFIPPSAPHFGGLWEAGIKSVKFHLKRVIKDHRLTYEEMYTLLTKVEALLNSRPMWPTSDGEPLALSPAHFLIGEPYTAIPHSDNLNQHVCPYINWSLLQALTQGFWKRWHAEYLTSLQQRPKWQNVKSSLAVGDIVMLKDPHIPPSKWILGRIKVIHPGTDQRVRVATISTQTGEYMRPITKLAPLPFSEGPEPFRGG